MNKVTYFDVEFANPKNKSICQLGVMCEDYNSQEPYYPEQNIYINPEDGFSDICIKIHGITNDRVKDESTFPTVWLKIEKYFTNSVIIGHNVAGADLDALVKNLKRYKLDIPKLYYVCTLEIAKDCIPSYQIKNYSMGELCKYFDIDIDNAHDAFDDACACADLLKALIRNYEINIDDYVHLYEEHEIEEFNRYISNPDIRKSISEFYGIIKGFSLDNYISDEEKQFIIEWKNKFDIYKNHDEISCIIKLIDSILSDNIVTIEEVRELQDVIKKYLATVSNTPVTIATQVLDGILKGIILDDEISENECVNLRKWLYDNMYLSNHYPFDKVIDIVENILNDNVITKDESKLLLTTINNLLNPIESIKSQINNVENKHVCLTGNFDYGQKSKVEKYIIDRKGIIDNQVKKSTNILIIGNGESQSYTHGHYGTKVVKAIELQEKGQDITIIKESDFFSNTNN